MTPWDIRALLRAFGATSLALVVVWLVTAASDEGQLTVGARAGRTLPLAPLCSAVGAALALGTARVRQEARAFEALGRSPAQIGAPAALGAALPALLVAGAIAAVPAVDVSAFYPHAARSETFLYLGEGAFVSPSLGVSIDPDGETHALATRAPGDEANLPRGARVVASVGTGLAGLAFALLSARATLRRSLLDGPRRRRQRAFAIAEGFACAILTLVAYQAAAAGVAPSALALAPPLALLVAAAFRLRPA